MATDHFWIPATEADIQLAINEGNLKESSYLDVKRETGSTDGSRAETARDLASFALNGGALLIGVAEDNTTGAFSLAPQPLSGAAEKLEQIAATRVEPPLFIRVRNVPSEADPSMGYLFAEVPPSRMAPHMVNGIYQGRGDRTKRRLNDHEVVSLHAARVPIEDRLRTLLHAWQSRKISNSVRTGGRLYIVAEPLSQITPSAFRAVSRASNNTPALNLAMNADSKIPRELGADGMSPLRSAPQWYQRAEGGALSTLDRGAPFMNPKDNEEYLVDLELHDNGGFRLVVGRLTFAISDGRSKGDYVLEYAAAGYAWRTLVLAQEISSMMGYRGTWGFGLAGDELANATSAEALNSRSGFSVTDRYAQDTYEEFTEAHLLEIETVPQNVVDRLIGRLMDALGTHERFANMIGPMPE